MEYNISAKRKNDAVITIRQDSVGRRVYIEGLNRAAERLTGYLEDELKGHDFIEVLPERVKDIFESFIDFDDNSSDVASILRKVINFEVLSKERGNVAVSLKVFYVVSSSPELLEFELLMRDITLIRKLEELKTALINSNQSLQQEGGLMAAKSIDVALGLIYKTMESYYVEATFAELSVDNMEEYAERFGEEEADMIFKSVAKIVKSCCRAEDVVADMGSGNLGLILFDCNSGDAKIVLNRIRMKIASTPIEYKASGGGTLEASVTVVFLPVRKGVPASEMFDKSKENLMQAKEVASNRIHEIQ